MRAAGPAASLSEQAYYAIRELILRGKLPMGAALSRRQLATQLGMSMLPLSEAVQRLENEGLLESKPQVGTRVRIPTERDIRESFQVREALESQCARLFAERATYRQRQDLKMMAEHMDTLNNRLAVGTRDLEFLFAVNSYHFQFHMRIAEFSGCAALQQVIQEKGVLVFNWLWDLTSEAVPDPPRFHRELAEAISGGGVEAADRAMRSHVRWGIEDTVRGIAALHSQIERKWRLRTTAATNQAK